MVGKNAENDPNLLSYAELFAIPEKELTEPQKEARKQRAWMSVTVPSMIPIIGAHPSEAEMRIAMAEFINNRVAEPASRDPWLLTKEGKSAFAKLINAFLRVMQVGIVVADDEYAGKKFVLVTISDDRGGKLALQQKGAWLRPKRIRTTRDLKSLLPLLVG
jgi:hypothetical protein